MEWFWIQTEADKKGTLKKGVWYHDEGSRIHAMEKERKAPPLPLSFRFVLRLARSATKALLPSPLLFLFFFFCLSCFFFFSLKGKGKQITSFRYFLSSYFLCQAVPF